MIIHDARPNKLSTITALLAGQVLPKVVFQKDGQVGQ